MSIIKCQSCGAPLTVTPGEKYSICEYCGSQTVMEQPQSNYIPTTVNDETLVQNQNGTFLSIQSCGSSIFQKKIFNIYGKYAELVDEKTGAIEQHVDFIHVLKYQQMLGMAMIVFKMSNGQRIFIKCLYERKTKEVLNVLNGLVKPIKLGSVKLK